MKTKEQQVEELENFLNEDIDDVNREIVQENAKLLKAEIEKGCRVKEQFKPFRFCGYIFQGKTIHCIDCYNLIERLKKIIGEELKERSEE